MKRLISHEALYFKAISLAVIAAIFLPSSVKARYLPESDDWSRRYSLDGPQLPENAESREENGQTTVIGKLIAKWLIAEYNKKGIDANKMYRLLKEPSSDCKSVAGLCTVDMTIKEVTCDMRSDVENCVLTSQEIEICSVTINMETLEPTGPVLCGDEGDISAKPNDSDEKTMLSKFIAREDSRKARTQADNNIFRLKDLEVKKWDQEDGKFHPI